MATTSARPFERRRRRDVHLIDRRKGQTATLDVVASASGRVVVLDRLRSLGDIRQRDRTFYRHACGGYELAFVRGVESSRYRQHVCPFSVQHECGANRESVWTWPPTGKSKTTASRSCQRSSISATRPDSFGTSLWPTMRSPSHAQGTGNVFLGTGRDLGSGWCAISGFANSDDNERGHATTKTASRSLRRLHTGSANANFTAVASVAMACSHGGSTSTATASSTGRVNGLSRQSMQAANNLSFAVPFGATSWNRSQLRPLPLRHRHRSPIPTGRVNDGEVEDYRIEIQAAPTLQASDSFFGDDDEVAELLGSL